MTPIDAVLATGSDTVELVGAFSRPLSTRLMYYPVGLDDPFDAVMDVVWRWMDEEYHVVPEHRCGGRPGAPLAVAACPR